MLTLNLRGSIFSVACCSISNGGLRLCYWPCTRPAQLMKVAVFVKSEINFWQETVVSSNVVEVTRRSNVGDGRPFILSGLY